MNEIFFFFAGYIISGAVSILLMCHMQINRFRQYSEQLKALLSSDKKNENNGEDHSDDSK